jgi:hypothetical protein
MKCFSLVGPKILLNVNYLLFECFYYKDKNKVKLCLNKKESVKFCLRNYFALEFVKANKLLGSHKHLLQNPIMAYCIVEHLIETFACVVSLKFGFNQWFYFADYFNFKWRSTFS